MAEMSLSEYTKQTKSSKRQGFPPRTTAVIVGIVVVAAISFVGGIQYQKGKTSSTTASSRNASAYQKAGGFGGGFQRGDRAIGTVTAVSSTSISVQTRSGSTSTYTLTSGTTVTDSGQSSSVSDIQTGDTVFLTLDSSNTKDVTSIMLNPSFGGGFGGSGGANGQTNSGSNTDSNTGSDNSTSGA